MRFRFPEFVANILWGTNQQRTKLINRLRAGFYCAASGNTDNWESFARDGLHFGMALLHQKKLSGQHFLYLGDLTPLQGGV